VRKKEERKRESCIWELPTINPPKDIKRIDLNKAWANRCINAKTSHPSLTDIVINPRCLKVDKATTFFKSTSTKELTPA
jgi:hypothetical protein